MNPQTWQELRSNNTLLGGGRAESSGVTESWFGKSNPLLIRCKSGALNRIVSLHWIWDYGYANIFLSKECIGESQEFHKCLITPYLT